MSQVTTTLKHFCQQARESPYGRYSGLPGDLREAGFLQGAKALLEHLDNVADHDGEDRAMEWMYALLEELRRPK